MSVYTNLKSIRKLSNASLTSIIDVNNLNFKNFSEGNLEFLNNINYNEVQNSISLFKGTFELLEVTNKLSMTLDGIPTLTVNSLGKLEGQELLVKVSETKRQRFTDFPDWPDIGVPGEIIYTGIQNQRPEFGEDFIGYLQTKGWVSLTEGSTSNYLTLVELPGSPPFPPNPAANQGIVWIGFPGYETAYTPTTQTVYYTDENGQIFDLTYSTGAPGPAGPSGPAGTTGAQGPAGPTGPAGQSLMKSYVVKLLFNSGSIDAATPFLAAEDSDGNDLLIAAGWTFTRNSASQITIIHPEARAAINFVTHAENISNTFVTKAITGTGGAGTSAKQNLATTTLIITGLSPTFTGVNSGAGYHLYLTWQFSDNTIFI